MKRAYYYIAGIVAIFVLMFSCGKNPFMSGDGKPGNVSAEILLVQLGEVKETEGKDRDFEHEDHVGGEKFVPYTDSAAYKKAIQYDSTVTFEGNLYEFYEGLKSLQVKVYPSGVKVNSMKLESSDPSILKVVKLEDDSFVMAAQKLGDVVLKLTIEGDKNTIVSYYPVRVYTEVELTFYIQPYWLQELGINQSRIRYKLKKPNHFAEDLIVQTSDSVVVIGCCEYFDIQKSRLPLVIRDTVTYKRKDKVEIFEFGKREVVRNITKTVRDFNGRYTMGNYLEYINGEPVYIEHKYYWFVEQVQCHFYVWSHNPYIQFTFVTKCKKSHDTWDEYEMTEEDKAYYDGGNEADMRRLEKSEKAYFGVLVNPFTTQAEMDSLSNALNDELKRYGYKPELSEEEKQKRIDEINKHKKDGDDD